MHTVIPDCVIYHSGNIAALVFRNMEQTTQKIVKHLDLRHSCEL